ncbi:MAG: hypothetical protein ACLRWP_11445 [Bilophila wadsworthia]
MPSQAACVVAGVEAAARLESSGAGLRAAAGGDRLEAGQVFARQLGGAIRRASKSRRTS